MTEYTVAKEQEGMGGHPYPLSRTRGRKTSKIPLVSFHYSVPSDTCQGTSATRIASILAAVLLILSVTSTACTASAPSAATTAPLRGSPFRGYPSPATPTQPSPPAFTEEDVGHAVALAQMAGHLQASLANWEAGDYNLAALHAAHPVGEVWGIVFAELEEADAAASLKEALDAYQALSSEAGDAEEVKTAHQAALDAIATAEQILAGDVLDDPVFQAQVVRKLLTGVQEEYAEAARDGRIVEVEEYQDAWGFFTVASERYAAIEATVEAAYPRGHEEIEAKFAELEAAFPGVTPPAQPIEPSEVEEAAREIAAELGEALGLGGEVAQTPAEIISQIREKVSHALEEYEEGETDEAYELAISAYLDGFEHVEGDLLQKGEGELVETLELQFKDLRDGIKAGKPLDELRVLAAGINANLDKVEELLK